MVVHVIGRKPWEDVVAALYARGDQARANVFNLDLLRKKRASVKAEPAPPARAFQVGSMVRCPDGRIGMLAEVSAFASSHVKFGSDGPFSSFDWKDLVHATESEILGAGLRGVGYLQA